VSVELGSSDGRVVFTVADTGIGIAPGDLPHVFDRFWRADSARTRTSERPVPVSGWPSQVDRRGTWWDDRGAEQAGAGDDVHRWAAALNNRHSAVIIL